MEEVYVVLPNSETEWEDIRIFLSKEEAIDALNKIGKDWRIEIFRQQKGTAYTPTYDTINSKGNVKSNL